MALRLMLNFCGPTEEKKALVSIYTEHFVLTDL